MEHLDLPVKELIKAAMEAKKKAYTPYSGYQVGAALLTNELRIYTGCNIENSSFSMTNCAERTAVFKAVSEGYRNFEAICIIGGLENENKKVEIKNFCPPCGVCRQVLAEFCSKDFKIILAKSKTDYKVLTLGELLPEVFSL